MVEETKSKRMALRIRELLQDKKGIEAAVLEVRELGTLTDFFVMATGTGAPHLKAMAAEVENKMRDEGFGTARTAGTPTSGWLILDYTDVIVHLFTESLRRYYALEQLWGDARRLP